MKVSIITINRNNAEGLEKTIRSVVSQSYDDYEYIVIDGASDDGSVDIIKRYAGKISYWISEPDTGIYNAMNKGIRQANGEYLLFLNSADYINEDVSFKDIFKELNSGEDIIFFDMRLINENRSVDFVKHYPDNVDFLHLIHDTLPHQASFLKRRFLVNYGCYNEGYDIISDWIFYLDAICIQNASYKHVRDFFSTFSIDGISSRPENQALQIEQRFTYLKKNYKAFLTMYNNWKKLHDDMALIKASKAHRFVEKAANLWMKIKNIK